jgi:TolB-like protein
MRQHETAAVLTLALAGSIAAAPLSAQQSVSVAVLAFQNAGVFGQDEHAVEQLRTQLPAQFVAELGRQKGITATDRSSSSAGTDGRVDAAEAASFAQQASARYAVTGNFLDHFGRFRLNAEIVDAESGQIIKVITNEDPALQRRDKLAQIVQLEAARIAEVLRQLR